MIVIFRPKRINRLSTACRYCEEKTDSPTDTVSMETGIINWKRWNFHNECFIKFRQKINKVNIYDVKEK